MIELLATAVVPLFFMIAWLIEWRWPARPYVAVRGWARLGVAFFVLTAIVGSATPLLLARTGVVEARLFDMSAKGAWAIPVGLVVTSGVYYALHRAEHRFDWLWRATHQLHHSALRVDIPGAFYAHPLEVAIKTGVGVLVTTVVLGMDPSAASVTLAFLALLSLFQHWNIHTPRWLGYLIPRPEMHALHHEADVHGRNFGDLPIWDMLFGTYLNPERFEGTVGFEPKAASALTDMMLMRDVNRPRAAEVGESAT